MPTLVRLYHVLRRGPPARRAQAGVGVVILLATLGWFVWHLWQILLLAVGFLVGIFLIARSLRGSPPSSSSS